MKQILVIGSIAYDYIMEYGGKFRDVLVGEEIKNLSVSFQSKSRRMFFGGCGANIAYGLSKFGFKPFLYGVVGNDFSSYRKWMKENKIQMKYVYIDKELPSAAAYILGDSEENQIAIFSPEAMANESLGMNLSNKAIKNIDLAIVSPALPARMVYMADYLSRNGIPYILDPGQAITNLTQEELMMMVGGAEGVICNEYERSMLDKKLGGSFSDLLMQMQFFVETRGKKGCLLCTKGTKVEIPALPGVEANDVTGCGDAFRAGFIFGYANYKDLKRCCEMGSVAATSALLDEGAQTYDFTMKDFEEKLSCHYS